MAVRVRLDANVYLVKERVEHCRQTGLNGAPCDGFPRLREICCQLRSVCIELLFGQP